jgi:hypothetical protein
MIAITRTSIQPDVGQGQPGAKPTPLQTGISTTLQAEMPKMNPEIAAKVADVVRRKP